MKWMLLLLSLNFNFSLMAQSTFTSDFEKGAYWFFPVKVYVSNEGLNHLQHQRMLKAAMDAMDLWKVNMEAPMNLWELKTFPSEAPMIIIQMDFKGIQDPGNILQVDWSLSSEIQPSVYNPILYSKAIVSLNPNIIDGYLEKENSPELIRAFAFALALAVGLERSQEPRSIMFPISKGELNFSVTDIMAMKALREISQIRMMEGF